jgi:hypothetical protein
MARSDALATPLKKFPGAKLTPFLDDESCLWNEFLISGNHLHVSHGTEIVRVQTIGLSGDFDPTCDAADCDASARGARDAGLIKNFAVLASRLSQLAAASALINCSPFDPDLGPQPYLCSAAAPSCPDGYTCVARPGRDHVCQRDEMSPDSGGNTEPCSADMREPNETIEAPTIVPIPEMGEVHEIAAVLCPETDLDVYRLNVDVTGKSVRVEIGYDSRVGPLDVALLNSIGVVIRTAMPTNGDANKLRADFNNLAAGLYYGRVQGMQVRAGYDVSFIVTSGALPP